MIDKFANLPSSRKEALSCGLTYFFSRKPCIRGHIDKRYAKSNTCVSCDNEKKLAGYYANRDEVLAKQKEYRDNNNDEYRKRIRERYHRDVELTRKKSREYYDLNRDRRRELARIWYHANNDRAKEINKASKERHPETKRACNQRWAFENPEKVTKSRYLWKQKNPEKIVAAAHRRRAIRAAAEGTHTYEDVKSIRALQGDRCAYCRKRLNGRGHLDHIIALAKGGTNWPNNLQFLCEPCNTSKQDKDPIDFMRTRGNLL